MTQNHRMTESLNCSGHGKALFFACLAALSLLSCDVQSPTLASDQGQESEANSDNWWDGLPRAAWSPFEKISITQEEDWFQVYRIRDGVYAIHEDGQWEAVISYLIEGEASALLFDSGLGVGDIASIVAQLTSLPVALLNSHSHYDHVGGNYQFEKIYALDLPYAAQRTAGRGNDEVRGFLGPEWVWKTMPAGMTQDLYSTRPYTISDLVEDGEVIDLGGVEVEVVTVPGHTPDSLVLLDRQRRLLFMGDTFYPATLYAHLGDSDFDDYVQSSEKLTEMASAVDFLLPAHNEPLVPSYYLRAMRDAFRAIQAPNAPYKSGDGTREYDFDGFQVLVGDPPPWQ